MTFGHPAMADSAVCRSSAGCLEPATAGTFGRYFCAEHFAEIDGIRQRWFGADGSPLRREREPGEAAESLSSVAQRIRDLVAAARPFPVHRDDIRKALKLPKEIQARASTIAANGGLIVSTPQGFILGGRRSAEDRARDVAEIIHAAGGEQVTMARLCAATGMTPTGSASRVVRLALARGWIEDQRSGRAGGLVPGPVLPPAARAWQAAA